VGVLNPSGPNAARQAGLIAQNVLAEPIKAAIGDRPVGIFSTELSYAPINNLKYSPLPVFQNYAAYTSYLDNLNAEYLNGDKAPPVLLTNFLTTDGRHCLIDVPATWLAMYRWYESSLWANGLLLLERRTTPRFTALDPIGAGTYGKSEIIRIPDSSDPVVVKISLDLGLEGILLKTLYRINPVEMVLTSETGRPYTFRIMPDTLRNGVLLNYLPIHLHDLDALLNNNTAYRKFLSFELKGKGLKRYKDSIAVQFLKIPGASVKHETPAASAIGHQLLLHMCADAGI
jgi:hypothetical protein